MKKHILPISVLALALTSQAADSKWSAGVHVGYSQTKLKAKSVANWTVKPSPSAAAFSGIIDLSHKLTDRWSAGLLFGYDTATVKFASAGNISVRYKPRWSAGLGFHHMRTAGENMTLSLGVNGIFNFARTEEKDTASNTKKSSTLFSVQPVVGLHGPLTDTINWNLKAGYKFALHSSKNNPTAAREWKFKTKPHGLTVHTGITYKF